MTIQLMGKDDGSFEDYDVYTGRWQAYIDSFVSVSYLFLFAAIWLLKDEKDNTTRGFSDVKIKPPFLTRCVLTDDTFILKLTDLYLFSSLHNH